MVHLVQQFESCLYYWFHNFLYQIWFKLFSIFFLSLIGLPYAGIGSPFFFLCLFVCLIVVHGNCEWTKFRDWTTKSYNTHRQHTSQILQQRLYKQTANFPSSLFFRFFFSTEYIPHLFIN